MFGAARRCIVGVGPGFIHHRARRTTVRSSSPRERPGPEAMLDGHVIRLPTLTRAPHRARCPGPRRPRQRVPAAASGAVTRGGTTTLLVSSGRNREFLAKNGSGSCLREPGPAHVPGPAPNRGLAQRAERVRSDLRICPRGNAAKSITSEIECSCVWGLFRKNKSCIF